ncbi:MAG: DUF4159 domain-containing protein [Cellvibrionaceae bacterium]
MAKKNKRKNNKNKTCEASNHVLNSVITLSSVSLIPMPSRLFCLSSSTISFLILIFVTLSLQQKALADPLIDIGEEGEFSFVRLQFETRGSSFRFMPWSTDFPAADKNFLRGVSRLTNIKINREPIVKRLDDADIFNYPFLYAVEMGRNGGVRFSSKEVESLREYLKRGGFLFIDDFWGTQQWDNFYRMFQMVFPEKELVELKNDHEIFHGFYDVDGAQMIPALSNYSNRPESDIEYASNHAILDDDGRVMVLINWNSDIGDGWEHTYHSDYPTKYANLAYRLGINYMVYALTH